MPNPPLTGGTADILHTGTVVFVGANGSGKSRLGAWIESSTRKKTGRTSITRIAAQRALSLPGQVLRVTPRQGEQELHGTTMAPGNDTRMQGDPILSQLNDYDALLKMLFAVYSAEVGAFYRSAKNNSAPSAPPNEDILERFQTIWSQILPHRPIVIDTDEQQIKTTAHGGIEFAGQNMSDGERVALYLIAHALLASRNATILVDEPELHIHQSVQTVLWNALELARPDCTFIYITHDLPFAASRREAVTIYEDS